MIYEFEELQIPGYGLGVLMYGTTIIADDGDTGEDLFVSLIVLDGGKRMERPRDADLSFDALIYRVIENTLCDPRTEEGAAVLERWADHVAGVSEPDPDYAYEEKRDRQNDF